VRIFSGFQPLFGLGWSTPSGRDLESVPKLLQGAVFTRIFSGFQALLGLGWSTPSGEGPGIRSETPPESCFQEDFQWFPATLLGRLVHPLRGGTRASPQNCSIKPILLGVSAVSCHDSGEARLPPQRRCRNALFPQMPPQGEPIYQQGYFLFYSALWAGRGAGPTHFLKTSAYPFSKNLCLPIF
jgi:hypothetical protein